MSYILCKGEVFVFIVRYLSPSVVNRNMTREVWSSNRESSFLDQGWNLLTKTTTGDCLLNLVSTEKWSVSHSVVSDSVWPHGLEPTRFLCPWNSPGKNTGMDSHCLLQGIFRTQGLTLVCCTTGGLSEPPGKPNLALASLQMCKNHETYWKQYSLQRCLAWIQDPGTLVQTT